MTQQRKITGLSAKWYPGLLLTLMVVFAACLLSGKKCEAADYTLNMNGAWNSATIVTEGSVDLWYFTVQKPGWVTFTYQGQSIGGAELSVWDNDLTKRFSRTDVYTSSDAAPITKEIVFAFEAGTYCAKIDAFSGCSGNYRVKAGFSPANNTETEPNDSFATAMPLAEGNKVTGFISLSLKNDETFDTDFYQIVVPKKQKVTITYTQMLRGAHIELWNVDQIKIWKADVYYASEDSPLTEVYEETLDPGIYYFKVWVNTYADNAGRYYLRWDADPGEIKVESITVSGNASLKVGEKSTFSAAVLPANATNRAVAWSSSNSSVAVVDANGVVTGVGAGTATITAAAADGSNVTGTRVVTVEPSVVKVKSITVSGNASLKVGEKSTFSAAVLPANATNRAVAWSSSNGSVAVVDANGVVTGVGAGTATITAAAADGSNVTGTRVVTVQEVQAVRPVQPSVVKAASISISGNQRVAAGSKFTLKATVAPSNVTNAKVSWSPSAKSVATVSSAGKVTTKKPGKTVITATACDGSGVKESVTVIVLPKKVSFKSLKTSGSKKLKMTWSSQKSISGYQIRIATKKSFSGAKTIYVTKKTSKTKILTGLKKNKRYYVKLRSYIKIDGVTYYGAWSKTRNRKTK